jgi:LytR cell envelope-related transcriptional attenuator
MARVETPQGTPGSENPPGDDLDEWFTRRLESQGIPSRLGAPPLSRIAAVVGLALAALGLLWALSSVGPKTTTVTPPASTGHGGTTSTGGNGKNTGHPATITWRTVTVDVLNGYGGTGAAGAAATTLRSAGWKVGITGNATGITKTEVVYLSGFKHEALAVANKLKLGAPIKIGNATGVVPSSTNGVAIVLGPGGLPATV